VVHAAKEWKNGIMKINTSRKAGFTIVELMIVVAIIGLWAAIAIPNFIRARSTSQMNTCISNLRQIDSAKQRWALETGALPTAAPSDTDILPYIGRSGGVLPSCPLWGPPDGSIAAFDASYNRNDVSMAPTCRLGIDPNYLHQLN
jgi:prepilin-type N-terminal cleavage/methylation domain-containing protein